MFCGRHSIQAHGEGAPTLGGPARGPGEAVAGAGRGVVEIFPGAPLVAWPTA